MKVQGLVNWCAQTDVSVKPLISVTRLELRRTRALPLCLQNEKIFSNSSRCPIKPCTGDDGCFQFGMGNKVPRPPICRSLRSVPSPQRYSNQRNDYDFLGFTCSTPIRKRSGHKYRLFGLNSCPKKRTFSKSNSGSSLSSDLETSQQIEIEPKSQPYKRKLQCQSGPVVQELCNINRMESVSNRLSSDNSKSGICPRNRLVCHGSKSQDNSISVPLSRSSSCGNRLFQCGLESMGESLPVSPNRFDFQGFSQVMRNKVWESNFSVPTIRRQSMVPQSASIQEVQFSNITQLTTSCQQQTNSSGSSYKISRLDFIQQHFRSRLPQAPRASELMSMPIRSSSQGDYERKWQQFLSYLHSEGVQLEQCNLQHVLNFLTMLFDKKNL